MGESGAQIARAHREQGLPVPPGYEEPTIARYLVFIIEAYDSLTSCRSGGMIPWTAVLKYAEHYCVKDFDFFWLAIHAMDVADIAAERAMQKERTEFDKLKAIGSKGGFSK